jgi:lysozyme
MTPSQNCINFIKKFEGLFLKSYLCPAGVATIGYGSTMWNDNKKVELGQTVSLEGAEKLLMWELENKAKVLQGLNLNQNQFDSLLSFIYNVGTGAFKRSTMLKKIKVNPNDATIRDEFMRWINKGSSFEKGLRRRRKAEADLYFSTI